MSCLLLYIIKKCNVYYYILLKRSYLLLYIIKQSHIYCYILSNNVMFIIINNRIMSCLLLYIIK